MRLGRTLNLPHELNRCHVILCVAERCCMLSLVLFLSAGKIGAGGHLSAGSATSKTIVSRSPRARARNDQVRSAGNNDLLNLETVDPCG